ncbi:Uncharacterized protein APZ42_001703 [Daphnia magna]|uniref:Uncharacterized protein n=1 Tax=Daphnia magna TaxID=35525 RepID=A0A164IT84_9CRUS|nr:Uncharacterized protein APZ42_001703 [Daphnia magna]
METPNYFNQYASYLLGNCYWLIGYVSIGEAGEAPLADALKFSRALAHAKASR